MRYLGATMVVYALFVFINGDARLLGFNMLAFLYQASQLKAGVTPVLIFATYPMSVFLFVYTTFVLRKLKVVALYFATTTPILAIILFEAIWHAAGAFFATFPFTVNAAGYLIIVSWFALGFASVRFWHFSKIQPPIVLAYAAFWIAWMAMGYPQIATGSKTAYFFNILLKIMSFLLVASLLKAPAEEFAAFSENVRST